MSHREVEEEVLDAEEEAIELLPPGVERAFREQRLYHLRQLHGVAEVDYSDYQNEDPSQEQIQARMYLEGQRLTQAAMIENIVKENKRQEERLIQEGRPSRRRRHQAGLYAEDLAPRLNEMRVRATALVTELSNLYNALYHPPTRHSVPEVDIGPPGGSSTGEPVYEQPEESAEPEGRPEESAEPEGRPEESAEPEGRPEESAEPEGRPEESAEPEGRPEESAEPKVADRAFYLDIMQRMSQVLERARQFLDSIPLIEDNEVQRCPNSESPLMLPGQQAGSLDPLIEHDCALSLNGASAFVESKMNMPFNSLSYVEVMLDYYKQFGQMLPQKPEQRSRTHTERYPSSQRDPFACKSPTPTKASRSKVPTPRDKSSRKPSEKDNHTKLTKKSTVAKQSEKDSPKTPVKKSEKTRERRSRKGSHSQPSEKETTELSSENKLHKTEKDAIPISRSEQRTRYGARPKTTATSVWGQSVTSTSMLEVSLPDQALVRTPVEGNSSPSTEYTSISSTPVDECALGIVDSDNVDSMSGTVNPSHSEFSRAYSSGQFRITRLPVRERNTRVEPPSQPKSDCLDISKLTLESPPPSPSIKRQMDNVGASGNSGASRNLHQRYPPQLLNIDLDVGALKLESPPSSPRDNRSLNREFGVADEFRERRIARVGSPSHTLSTELVVSDLTLESSLPSSRDNKPFTRESTVTDEVGEQSARVGSPSRFLSVDPDASSFKFVSPGQKRREANSSSRRRIGSSDNKSQCRDSKITTSLTGTSASIPKGASNTRVTKGASNTGVTKGASNTGVTKGASNTGVTNGASNTGVTKETLGTSVPKGASKTNLPKGASKTNLPKGASNNIRTLKGASNKSLAKEKCATSASKGASNLSVSSDRNRTVPKDSLHSISSKNPGVPKRVIGTSGVPQKASAIKGEGASTPSKVTSVPRRVASGISRVSKETLSSASKHTFSKQSSREVSASRREESKNNMPIESSSMQSKATILRQATSVQFDESAGMDPNETSNAKSSDATASEEETSVSVPFSESADIVPNEMPSMQSSEATATGEESSASVVFSESADIVPNEMFSMQSSKATSSGEESTVNVPLAESASIVTKESQSAMVAETANGNASVAEGTSDDITLKVEHSEASGVDSLSREDDLQAELEELDPCQRAISPELATQTKPDSRRQSDEP